MTIDFGASSKFLKKKPTAIHHKSSRTRPLLNDEFSDEALQAHKCLSAKSLPLDAEMKPELLQPLKQMQHRSRKASPDDSLINDEFGNPRPHYWGHRERLKARFLAGGHASMPEDEVLELLLFNAIARIDLKSLTKRLLSTFGDLNGVIAASEHRLLKVDGATAKVYLQLRIAEAFAQRMGQAKILKRSVLSSWDDIIIYCRTTMAHRETEQFRVLYLDRKNVLFADEEQAKGTVDHVPVYPREVAKRALELNASAIILVHNHPSGDPTPSSQDINMTNSIVSACRTINVTIHDHLIIGKGTEISFKSEGLLL